MNSKFNILIISFGLIALLISCRQEPDKVSQEDQRAVQEVARIEWPKKTIFLAIFNNDLDGLIDADFKVSPEDVAKILNQGEFRPIPTERKEKLLRYHASLNPIDSAVLWIRGDGNNYLLEMYINKETGIGHLIYCGRGILGD